MKRWIPVFFRRKIMYTDINNLKELQKENEELRQDIAQLNMDIEQLEEYKEENNKLYEEVDKLKTRIKYLERTLRDNKIKF